jgi:hypothetical protein
MTKVEAFEFLSTNTWKMWKPGGKGVYKAGVWHREDEFAGVQVVCTEDEWYEVLTALGWREL